MAYYDIARAKTAKATKWQNTPILWEDFVKWVTTPYLVDMPIAEYQKLEKSDKDKANALKDTHAFVGGFCMDYKRNANTIKHRSLIVLDADNANADLWLNFQLNIGSKALIYSTLRHTQLLPKFRLVIPLSRNVSPGEFTALTRILCNELGMEQFDKFTDQVNRLMYKHSRLKDSKPFVEECDGELLDPDVWLATLQDWKDQSCWPLWANEPQVPMPGSKSKLASPKGKDGVVGAFCTVYDIKSVIGTYLHDAYFESEQKDRYTYSKGTTSNGLIVYDNGEYAYSQHSTDPVADGHSHNAFDLVRIHKFGELDRVSKDGDSKKSFAAMVELCNSDELVKAEILKRDFDIVPNTADGSSLGRDKGDWLIVDAKTGATKIQPVVLSRQIEKEIPLIYGPDLKMYYDSNKGLWRDGAEQIIQSAVTAKCGIWRTPKVVTETTSALWDRLYNANQEVPQGNKDWLVLDGGRYNIPKGQYFDCYDKELLAVTSHPIRYDPTAQAPTFTGFIKEQYGDAFDLICELGGYCMYQGYPIQKIFFIVGKRGSGKSTLIDILQTVIGEKAYSNVTAQQLVDEDKGYKLISLYGKTANFDANAKAKYLDNDEFILKATGGDKITARDIYKTSKRFTNNAKMVIAYEDLPVIRSHEGMGRRVIVIESQKQITDEVKQRYPKDKIMQEMSGIFNLFMDGLRRLLQNKDFTMTESMKQATTEYIKDNDPVGRFVETLEKGITHRNDKLYERYREWWSIEEGMKNPFNNVNFGKHLKRLGFIQTADRDKSDKEDKKVYRWWTKEAEM